MREIILIVHNIRSCHNVGALLRAADGFGVAAVWFTGYTPYPLKENDSRLPHVSQKINKQIHKTALGAEDTVHWKQDASIRSVINSLHEQGYNVIASEQAANSTKLPEFKASAKIALIFGHEVKGIEDDVLLMADACVEIPMLGRKESFNVAQAAAIVLYHLRYT